MCVCVACVYLLPRHTVRPPLRSALRPPIVICALRSCVFCSVALCVLNSSYVQYVNLYTIHDNAPQVSHRPVFSLLRVPSSAPSCCFSRGPFCEGREGGYSCSVSPRTH